MAKYFYWIDESCNRLGEKNFDLYIREAMRLARVAVSRLENPNDTDFARVFNFLLKTPKTDKAKFKYPDQWYAWNECVEDPSDYKTTLDHVIADLSDFSTSWARTGQRDKAEVRIYADQGQRYEEDPQVPGLWQDHENGVNIMVKNLTGPLARTCHPAYCPPPKKFVTMDFFDRAWIGVRTKCLQSLKRLEFADGTELSMKVDDFSLDFLAVTILHEFMHCNIYGRVDAKIQPGMGTSGWKYCLNLNKDESRVDAECIALLAFVAGWAEVTRDGKRIGGFTIARSWDKIQPGCNELALCESEEQKKKMEGSNKWNEYFLDGDLVNTAAQGMLIFYDDITS